MVFVKELQHISITSGPTKNKCVFLTTNPYDFQPLNPTTYKYLHNSALEALPIMQVVVKVAYMYQTLISTYKNCYSFEIFHIFNILTFRSVNSNLEQME